VTYFRLLPTTRKILSQENIPYREFILCAEAGASTAGNELARQNISTWFDSRIVSQIKKTVFLIRTET